MTQCLFKSIQDQTRTLKKQGAGCATARKPGSCFYVVDKVLYKAQAADATDLVRVEEFNRRERLVTLQPLLTNKYVVSFKDFKKNYIKV